MVKYILAIGQQQYFMDGDKNDQEKKHLLLQEVP